MRSRKLRLEQLEQRTVFAVGFPADANVIDVAAVYGAIPNDGVDDTAAVQQAINDWVDRNRILYFRDGVYDFSAPIEYGKAGGVQKGVWIQGESEAGTRFR